MIARRIKSALRMVVVLPLLLVSGCRLVHPPADTTMTIFDVFPRDRPAAGGFTIEYRDQPGGERRTAALDIQHLTANRLRLAGHGCRVEFSVTARGTYLVLRITKVTEQVPGTLLQLGFAVDEASPFVLTRLDYMTVPTRDDKGMSWPWIWARVDANPLGAFAIQAPRDDAAFDENLLRMWVADGLPQPQVDGDWTLDRARHWLTDWQARFSDQSCLVIGATNRAELDRMTDWATKLGMKRVYLHTDTWRGEYWPREYSYLHVNRAVFPRGEQDLNQYTRGLVGRGMSFAVHSTCISIGMNDPDYVRRGLHPDLARWVRGTLAKPAGAADDTLWFRPPPGTPYPQTVRHGATGPGTIPSFMNLRLYRVGDEIVDVGSVEETADGVWILRQCRRGDFNTRAAAHPAGTVTEGILRGYGQAFVPDADSALFRETIRRWAEFCSRNNVDHLECDALEIHLDKPWGANKFSWLLSSELRLPSTSNTSGGRPLPFHIEYWFRGSQLVRNNHANAGAAGGASLPLYLHSDIRPATGPYEILHKPAEMVGGGGNSFNISYPWPMFGVTPEILDNHGLVPLVEDLVRDWRTVLATITPDQRERSRREYTAFRSPTGQAGNQAGTDVLFRPEIVAGQPRIVPLRMVGRTTGELNWGFGQEFGPIVPRQYLCAGESLSLTNPSPGGEPEFVIRVLGGLVEVAADDDATGQAATDDDEDAAILEAYATGTTTEQQSVHPLRTAQHTWPAVAMVNGEAQPGTVTLRRTFTLPETAVVRRARLYLQVDDEAEAFVNGRKVFRGGRYDRCLFVPVRNLRPGKNEIRIRATNGGGAGSLAAALHYRLGDDTAGVVATDSTWHGRIEDGADHDWSPVTALAAYGAAEWPRARPESGALRRDLMPRGSTIEPVEGHEVVLADDDVLEIRSENDTDEPAIHLDDRPAWETSIDMSNARGLGCTVSGDGSGAVLVITIEGRGNRDYVIPIDFKGTREITIPNGEVAWGHPRWGWRFHSARFDYSRITRVQVGFGTVPARTTAHVTVKNIRPLRAVDADLRDLVLRLGDGDGADIGELEVTGAMPVDHVLWYRGGDTVGLYDPNWNKLRELPLRRRNFRFPAGPVTLHAAGTTATSTPQSWLEVQFFVQDTPLEP